MVFFLDGNMTRIDLNGTTTGDEVSLMYHADNMEDGDHQLRGGLFISGAFMEIDYFECVVPSLHSVPRTVC